MAYRNFDEMITAAKAKKRQKSCAAVWTEGTHTITAVLSAYRDCIIRPLFVGNEREIRRSIEEAGESTDKFQIVPARDKEESAYEVARLAGYGQAEIVLKGQLETALLMKAVLNQGGKLRTGRIISNLGVFEVPTYHKLLCISDGGVNLHPDLSQKKLILENGVAALRGLGVPCPKVAVLSAIETVNPRMRETTDARALRDMNQRGEITNCIVEGPISYDLAVSSERAEIKEFKSPVTGDADLLICPDLTSANLTAKVLVRSSGSKAGSCVFGAKVPIVLPSRASPADEIYRSIVVAAAVDWNRERNT
jgi:phosphate butyryltransferase